MAALVGIGWNMPHPIARIGSENDIMTRQWIYEIEAMEHETKLYIHRTNG